MGNLLACCSGHTGEKLEEEKSCCREDGMEEEDRRVVDEEEGRKVEVPPMEVTK